MVVKREMMITEVTNGIKKKKKIRVEAKEKLIKERENKKKNEIKRKETKEKKTTSGV